MRAHSFTYHTQPTDTMRAASGSTSNKPSVEMAAQVNEEWSKDDEGMIVLMRNNGCGWREIDAVVKRGKRATQQHFKQLIWEMLEHGLSVEQLAKMYEDELKRTGRLDRLKAASPAGSSANNGGKSKKVYRKVKSRKYGDVYKKVKNNENEDIYKRVKSVQESSSSSDDDNAKSKKKSKKHKHGKQVTVTFVSSSESESDSDSDSETKSASGSSRLSDPEKDPAYERQAQASYLYQHTLDAMYPDQKVLRPGGAWTPRDCQILSVIEARYRADKWKHVSAEFANATGRMIAPYVLKEKFEEKW
ncbi:hypothetical protein F4779DRAFT_406666 [Xylariaceae sp. FL0662B]|nr:hypothetical protein F4779DRAFT_406666 [Xylariaceae sp. FL0662B]